MELSAGFRRDPAPGDGDPGEEPALAARIRAEIASGGPITFARFMALALYDPDGGYYRATASRPGRGGDFLTAPELHPIFGRAVARVLAEAWQRLGRPDPFVVYEHGAGSGALAEAIASGMQQDRPDAWQALRVVPIELDGAREQAVRDRLAAAGHDRVGTLTDAGPSAVIANEVLDALPVHRVGVRDGRLLERFVGLRDGAFVDAWGEPSTPALAERLAAEDVRLAEGQSAEVCLALDGWIADAVRPLERGLLLLVDYGAPAAELYDPARRPDGSLRGFARHRLVGDPYEHVGRQDLTVHVDSTAVDRAARAAGLEHLATTTQAALLLGAGAEEMLRQVQADPATTLQDYVALRAALLRLLDPAGMGGFRVLAYGRGWPAATPLDTLAWRMPDRPGR